MPAFYPLVSGPVTRPFSTAGAPGIADAGAAADTAFTVAVAVLLAEVCAGDDLPWEFLSSGLPAFPYYAEVSDAALTRVHAGDTFDWYAPS